jgi:3-hydroxybutyryl-CoA dehydratase
MKIEDIDIGDKVSYSQTITDTDVKMFAGVSGDHNPLHVDEEYAAESRFKGRIAHGLISGSFFSGLFGTQLPGPGCVYVAQSFEFKYPVYLGDTVTATAEVTRVDIEKRRVHFRTFCTARKKTVIDGKAEIYVPLEPEE